MTHSFLHYGALTDMKNRSLDAYCMFKDQSLGFVATTKIRSKLPNDPLKWPSPMNEHFATDPSKLISWKVTQTDDSRCTIWITEPLSAGIWAGLAESTDKGCDINRCLTLEVEKHGRILLELSDFWIALKLLKLTGGGGVACRTRGVPLFSPY